MLLARVAEISRKIAGANQRLEKIGLLADLLGELPPDEIEIAAAFLSGRTRQGRIGIGYNALHEVSRPPAADPSLEIGDLDRAFQALAEVSGPGSQRRRVEILVDIFRRATEPEQRFISALIMGELRQGALEGIMLEAVAKASGVALERVRRAAMTAGDVALVARDAIEHGEAGMTGYDVKLFQPVQPMLAQTAEDVEDAIDDLGEAALEFKLDGARVQAHKSGGDVILFSRAGNDVTRAAPEIVEAVRSLPANQLILDGEILSLREDGAPQPFQTTARRFGRKLDVEKMRAELPLSPFWFDLLYLDGGSLLAEPQSRRFAELERAVRAQFLIPRAIASSGSAAREFFEQSIGRGHEGIMAKARGSAYAAGARGRSWLKIKHVHTLDLTILAAEWGHGRRKGWLSNLHLGARDTDKGGFAMLGKTFKGLTDETLDWQTRELLKIEIARDAYTVYVEPKLVAEVAFNEIQVSSRYPSGMALRFARVKRYRTDKTAAEADTLESVKKLAGYF
ncbi:MAG: ATP-dependent DNA ligase [Bryobacteraceae bacterium]